MHARCLCPVNTHCIVSHLRMHLPPPAHTWDLDFTSLRYFPALSRTLRTYARWITSRYDLFALFCAAFLLCCLRTRVHTSRSCGWVHTQVHLFPPRRCPACAAVALSTRCAPSRARYPGALDGFQCPSLVRLYAPRRPLLQHSRRITTVPAPSAA